MIIITAGGTGGHIYPAISLAQSYQKAFPNNKILLVGTKTPIDREIYEKCGFEFQPLSFNRPGTGIIGKIKLPFQLILPIWQAFRIIKKNKPQLIAACGGFGCLPLAWVARFTGTPVILLEQNAIPGRVNRHLASNAKFVFSEFAEACPFFKVNAKFLHLGNPIRKEILKVDKTKSKVALLFMGGSQGATKINEVAFEIIPEIVKTYPELIIYHLTGKTTNEKYKLNEKYSQVKVLTFMDKMEEIYVETKLVVGRSGATSIAEISALGIPTLFIPYPYAMDDHQRANAKALVNIGAGVMIEESNLTPQSLKTQIFDLLNNSEKLAKISKAVLEWSKPDAGDQIIQTLRDSGFLK